MVNPHALLKDPWTLGPMPWHSWAVIGEHPPQLLPYQAPSNRPEAVLRLALAMLRTRWKILRRFKQLVLEYMKEMSKPHLTGEFRLLVHVPNDTSEPASVFNEHAVGKVLRHLQKNNPKQIQLHQPGSSAMPYTSALSRKPCQMDAPIPLTTMAKTQRASCHWMTPGQAGVERGCGGCVWLGEAGWFWLDGFTVSFQRVSNISEWFRHCLLAVTLLLLYMSKYACQVGVGFQCWSTPKDQYIQSLTVKLQGNRSYLKEPKIGHLSIFYQHMECQFLFRGIVFCMSCVVHIFFAIFWFNPSLCRCATFNMFFIRGIMTQQLHCLHSLIRWSVGKMWASHVLHKRKITSPWVFNNFPNMAYGYSFSTTTLRSYFDFVICGIALAKLFHHVSCHSQQIWDQACFCSRWSFLFRLLPVHQCCRSRIPIKDVSQGMFRDITIHFKGTWQS